MTNVQVPTGPMTQSVGIVLTKSTDRGLWNNTRLALLSVTCCGEQEARLGRDACDCKCHTE
jgi:hypothetical protein